MLALSPIIELEFNLCQDSDEKRHTMDVVAEYKRGIGSLWNLPRNTIQYGKRLSFCHVDHASGDPFKKQCRGSLPSYNGKDYFGSLPDELLREIFKFLPGVQERALCASVAKRWLLLQSHMHRNEFVSASTPPPQVGCFPTTSLATRGLCEAAESEKKKGHRRLTLNLTMKKATDIGLATIAIGARGLQKLFIQGSSDTRAKGVSDVGLSAVGVCCPTLRSLSLWNCPLVSDRGLDTLGKGCPLLEKVDLFECICVSDAGIEALARNSPRLSSFTVERCPKVGNPGIKVIAEYCQELLSLSIQACPLIDDQALMAIASYAKKLTHLRVGGPISNLSLLMISRNCRNLAVLSLMNMAMLNEEGFESLHTLPNLTRLSVSNCFSLNNTKWMEEVANLRGLKRIALSKCGNISDEVLSVLLQAGSSLIEILELEACTLSNQTLITALTNPHGKLKRLRLVKCGGIIDGSLSLVGRGHWLDIDNNNPRRRTPLKSICISECADVGDKCLATIGVLCQSLTELVLDGATNVTDVGIIALLECICVDSYLTNVSLSGCVNITDEAVSAIARRCGGSLTSLALGGCKLVSDKGLRLIAKHCAALQDLDASYCNVSDEGVEALLQGQPKLLSSLNLSGCPRITDNALHLIEECKSLVALNLKHCSGLTRQGLNLFASLMWSCDVLQS